MDNREKFNIKLMVDCEKQEPFYPVTHAQAIQVIDEGELKNLQDVLGVVLEFVRNFGSFDFGDKLELGYTSHNAFPGSDGKDLMDKMEELYPLATEVSQGELKPVTGGAIYDFVQGFAPSGRVEDGDTQAVTGDTVYDYILDLIGGTIEQDNPNVVTGGVIFNYLLNLSPNGTIVLGDTRPVSGDTVWNALSNIGDDFWDTDENYEGSIKLKSTSSNLLVCKSNETTIGNFNSTNENSIFTVGIGTSDENRLNALEVSNQITDSLKIPFNNLYISIQSHMRNEQLNLLHLSLDLFNKIELLISENLKPSATFSASSTGGNFYLNNTGIKFNWEIKDSNHQDTPPSNINSIKISYKNGNSYIPIIEGITDSNDSATYNTYRNFNFSNSGKTTLSFRMNINTTELNTYKDSSVDLYAPYYIWLSISEDEAYNSVLSNGTPVNCQNSLNCNITINGGGNYYVYIAIPSHVTMQAPSENFQPFKDAESGIEFNLSNEYYGTSSKTFTIVGESVTTNYNIVRSAASLLPGTTWHITNK